MKKSRGSLSVYIKLSSKILLSFKPLHKEVAAGRRAERGAVDISMPQSAHGVQTHYLRFYQLPFPCSTSIEDAAKVKKTLGRKKIISYFFSQNPTFY